MSNGRIDETIGPQQQLSAFLIIIQFTEIYSFLLWEFVHFHRGVLEGVLHMALWELIRLSDGLANRSFCRWDFSRVQLKSNWTVGKGLLTSDSKTFWKNRLILSKSLLLFFYGWFGNWFIWKELVSRSLKDDAFKDDVMLHYGNFWDIQMTLRIDHFVNRTFRESNWSPTEQLVKGC